MPGSLTRTSLADGTASSPDRPRAERLAPDLGILSRREREIALLVATGASNPQIAASLWITRRTVEFHLTNVYRKLGIGRRAQLAAVLGDGRCWLEEDELRRVLSLGSVLVRAEDPRGG